MDTVRGLIDEALIRHWSFPQRRFPAGGLLLVVQRRCDELLVRYAQSLEPIVGEARDVAAKVAGVLVGIDATGTPYFTTTSEDGYAVYVDGTGVPYFDFTQAPIATDPLGASSATPGFPLPDDFLKVIAVSMKYSDGRETAIDIITERARHNGPPAQNPVAYINGNRIVPVRAPLATSDDWSSVTSLRLSYMRRLVFTSLASTIRIPPVLAGAIVAGVAFELARSGDPKLVTPREKATFEQERKDADDMMASLGDTLLGDLRNDTVLINSD